MIAFKASKTEIQRLTCIGIGKTLLTKRYFAQVVISTE